MKNKWYFSLICSVLAAGMMIMPAGAEETEAVTESAAEETAQVWDSSSRLEDGIFTVYIQKKTATTGQSIPGIKEMRPSMI